VGGDTGDMRGWGADRNRCVTFGGGNALTDFTEWSEVAGVKESNLCLRN